MRLTISVRVATFVSAVSLSAYACGESTSPVAGIPVSLTLVPSTLSLDAIGDTKDLTATVYDAEGTVIDTTVLFEPSDPSIITVTAAGRVTATGVGVASVTASLGDLLRTSEVNVFPVGTDVSRVSGDAQTAVVGNPLPAPLVVEVSDPGNNPVPGIDVTFSVLAGGGSVSVDSAVTDANGQASTNFTLGTQAGSVHRVAVVAGGVGRTEFSATALPDVPTDAQASAGDGQIQPIGTVLPTDLGVFVVDQFGNGVPGQDVNFNVTLGDGLLSAAMVQTSANGVASVQWTLGSTIGAQTTEADVPGVIPAALVFTATGTNLTVASITPDSLQEGQSAQITGTFETAAANITVTVDGVSAQVTDATTTTIDIVVPVTPCFPARQVEVIVTTSMGGTAPALTKPVRPGAFLQMAVGEMRLLQDPSAFCLQFDQDVAFSNYLIGVQSATTGTGLTGVSVRGSAQGPGPAFAPAMPRAAFGDRTSAAPIVLSERQERWQRHRESEARAFAAEMAYVEALMGSGSRPRPAAAPARQRIPSTVMVGETVSFKVPTLGQSCSDFATITATVKAKGTRGIWLNDNANPSNGFTDADYQVLSDQLDNSIFDVDTSYFGEPTDLDGNGRIVVVVTQQLNQANPNVLGFVSPRDVFPVSQCDASNEAEVYYGKAPGSDYPRDRAVGDGPVLIAHEFAHIIQIGRRLIINEASFMSIFMAEGQATLAEEVVGHAVLGNMPGQNYDFAVAFDQAATDPSDWYVLPFDDLSFYFGRVFSGPEVADAPHSCSWLASNPAPCFGRPLWYGVTWSLLRWINDQFGPGLGGEKAIQKALVDNSLTGFANIENVVGEPIETLLAEWAATLYLDDRSATALPSRIDFPSWNLFDIFDVGGLPSSARLRPISVVFQDFTEDVDVRAGSTAYFLLSGNVTAPTAIRVRNQVDGVLPTTMQVFIVRTN